MSPSAISLGKPARFPRGLPARASTRTPNPRAAAARATAEPTKPVAPVTSTRSPGTMALLDQASAAQYGRPPKQRKDKLADRAGFEPAIPLQVYTLSKRAPSATRPPVR